MRLDTFLGTPMFLLLTSIPAHAAHNSNWQSASDALALGLPAIAASIALSDHDSVGLTQLSQTLVTAIGVSEILKHTISSTRPDRSDKQSFPSGHTAVAFAAAAFIDSRWPERTQGYRPWLFSAAAITGLARVKADKHRWLDVIAGGGIGYLSARWLTGPADGKQGMLVQPLGDGVQLSWNQKW